MLAICHAIEKAPLNLEKVVVAGFGAVFSGAAMAINLSETMILPVKEI